MIDERLATQYDAQEKQFLEGTFKYNGISRQAFYEMFDVPVKNKRILDVACGDGFDMGTYQNRGALVYGLDSSRKFTEIAKSSFPNVKNALMENIPYPDNFFDVVVSKYSIQTTFDLAQIIREMTRVLKPKGYLFYLAVDPMRQFMEKKHDAKDYFHQDMVESKFFEGKMSALEPSHTLNEYLSDYFFDNYRLMRFKQFADFPSSERIDGCNYPCFFIVKAQKIKL